MAFDLCRTIQSTPRTAQTPVLFLSSYDDISTKLSAFDAGGVDYIPKPVEGAELIARVSTHMRLREAYRLLAELQADQIMRLANAQDSIMPHPQQFPEARFQIALHQIQKAGGDFYDVLPVGFGVVDYIVADASGHDLSSSFWTAALKTLIVAYASAASSPRQVLQAINGALCRVLPSGVFLTLVYARLNRQSKRLFLVNCRASSHYPSPFRNQASYRAFSKGGCVGSLPGCDF